VRDLGPPAIARVQPGIGDVTTDHFGYFSLPFVERGPAFVIDVAAPDRLMATSWSLGLSGESMAGIVVTVPSKGQTVRGRVLDPAGQPLPGVSVRLDGSTKTRVMRLHANATTQ
jgi:hypothetical protein